MNLRDLVSSVKGEGRGFTGGSPAAAATLQVVRTLWLPVAMAAAGALWLLLANGGTIGETTRDVLHGLCAQRPTHSFAIGGTLLPFDGRMTGIYSGTLATWMVLALRGRLLTLAVPPWRVLLLLGAGVATMAIDGFNVLLEDIGLGAVYPPHNTLRLFTGFATGVALATLLSWLLGSSLFRLGSRQSAWTTPRDLLWAPPAAVGVFSALHLAPAGLYAPAALALVLSAWMTVTALVLVMVVAGFRLETQVMSLDRLHLPLAASALIAVLIIVGLAEGRFWLEAQLGMPQDAIAVERQVWRLY